MTMSKSKSTAAQKRAPATRGQPGRPAPAAPANTQENLEAVIAQAQHGSVNISPAKAVEMAGKLYSRGQLGQAERVCRQIISARPANPDAHNILGATLAARGKLDEAITSLNRAIELNP